MSDRHVINIEPAVTATAGERAATQFARPEARNIQTGSDLDAKPPSSSDIIAAEIIRGIYTGLYSPGQRLVEPDIIRRHGFSRSSVREAIKRLASDGVVRVSMHKGAHIRLLTRTEVDEVLAVAEVLMGLSSRLVATRINEGHNRERFTAAFEHLMAYRDGHDFLASTVARDQFFHTVADLSGNQELRRVLPFTLIQIARVQFRTSAVEERRYHEYALIGTAILNGKAALAEARTRRHLRQAVKTFHALPDAAFAPEIQSSV